MKSLLKDFHSMLQNKTSKISSLNVVPSTVLTCWKVQMETLKELPLLDLQLKMLKLLQLNIVDLNTWEEPLLSKKQNQENKEEDNKKEVLLVKVLHVSLETWASMLQKTLSIQSLKIVERSNKSELLKTKTAKYYIYSNV